MSKMKDELFKENGFMSEPDYPPFGLSTNEFAHAQEVFTHWARERIMLGIHYDKGTHQEIETKSPIQLLTEFREELADAVNYLTALDIWVQRKISDLRFMQE